MFRYCVNTYTHTDIRIFGEMQFIPTIVANARMLMTFIIQTK